MRLAPAPCCEYSINMSDNAVLYPRRLRERREAAGLTQIDAGRAVGIGQTQISNLENGRVNPPALALASRFAELYGTSIDYLVGLTDDWRPTVGGRAPSPAMQTIIQTLSGLNEAAQQCAVALVQTFAQYERQRSEDASVSERLLTALEAIVPQQEMEAILSLIEAGRTAGNYDAARSRLARLLAPEGQSKHPDENADLAGPLLPGEGL